MKTIDEIAKEYSVDLTEQSILIEGINIAQRWIPVEEELPEQGEVVLFKMTIDKFDNSSYVSTGHIDNKIPIIDFDGVDIERIDVTHWRPVDFK